MPTLPTGERPPGVGGWELQCWAGSWAGWLLRMLGFEPQRSGLRVGRAPRRSEIEMSSCLESKQKGWRDGCYLTNAIAAPKSGESAAFSAFYL